MTNPKDSAVLASRKSSTIALASHKSSPVALAPSLIAADWSRALDQVREMEQAGCEWLHFDAMDGQFVPNLTLGPMFLSALRAHSMCHFDAHLMICDPGERLDDFIKAGADSISVHWEGNPHLHRLIGHIKDGGAQAGVVLNPATPVAVLETVLPDLDYVLVMSVNPGFSGQAFLPLAIDKIRRLAHWRQELGLNYLIQVDGGVAPATAAAVVAAGADVLVCGSSIFNDRQTIAENVRDIRKAVASGLSERA